MKRFMMGSLFVCCLSLVVSSAARAQDETPPPKPAEAEAVPELQKKKEPAPNSAVKEDSSPSDKKPDAEAEGSKKEEKKETASEKKEREKKERSESAKSARKLRSEGRVYVAPAFATWWVTWKTGPAAVTFYKARNVLGEMVPLQFWSPTGFADSFPQLHCGTSTAIHGQVGGGIVLLDATNIGPGCAVYSVEKPVVVFTPWNDDTKTWAESVFASEVSPEGGIVLKEGNPIRGWQFHDQGKPGMYAVYIVQ